MVGLLNAILDAQNAQPYRGWNITKLNKAVDAAREHLGLPSIRELNPDIAAMQDHARANKDAIQSALQSPPAPEQDAVERDNAFCASVQEALKGDHTDLQKEAIILRAHRAALAAMQQAPVAEEPWGYGWYEMGGKKCARGYLPTIDYPRSEDVSEGPFPLYRRPQPQADAAVAVEQWQPIETAPRDGSRFLVWEKHYGIRIGRCKERADHDDWLSYMDAFGGSSRGGPRATHWMPLPTPPAAIRAGGHP